MPPETANSQTQQPLDAVSWLSEHPRIAVYIAGFCLWISVCLIIRIWIIHRRTRFIRKVIWSFIVLVPFFGWLAYCGCFTPLDSINTPCPTEHDWTSCFGGGGGFDSGSGGHH
jgi:bacteriorhodopsin